MRLVTEHPALMLVPEPDQPKNDNGYSVKYLETVVKNWLMSKRRAEQLLAERYYNGNHDILYRERTAISPEGKLEPIKNAPNNRLVDNQYRKLVDQKTNYVLGKPLTIATAKDEYLKELEELFSKDMYRKLRILARYAVDGGISWLCPYCDEDGSFNITVFSASEICPIWQDKLHTKLNAALRYYQEHKIDDSGREYDVEHVELYTETGMTHYEYRSGQLVQVAPTADYLYHENAGRNWGKIPIIPFKYNDSETPLIRNTKTLQDALNNAISDFENNMEEDCRNTILIIKNYDGTDVDGVRSAINTHGIIKVTTVDGVQGGVESLKVTVDHANYQAFLMQIKRALIENGRGFDAKEERMDGDPNQMNIESMYTDIDLDVNGMESEFQAGFESLRYFINEYLKMTNKPDYSEERVDFVFNRDIFINEDAKIDACVKSMGVISHRTIAAEHPWVKNLANELLQLKKEKDEEMQMQMDMAQKQAALAQQNQNAQNSKPKNNE